MMLTLRTLWHCLIWFSDSCQTFCIYQILLCTMTFWISKKVLQYYGNGTPTYKAWWKFNVLECIICWLTKPVSAKSAVLKCFVGKNEWIDILTHEIIYFVWNQESFGKSQKDLHLAIDWVCIIALTLWLGDTLAFNLLYWGCHWNAVDTMGRFLLHVGNKTVQ